MIGPLFGRPPATFDGSFPVLWARSRRTWPCATCHGVHGGQVSVAFRGQGLPPNRWMVFQNKGPSHIERDDLGIAPFQEHPEIKGNRWMI